MKTIFIVKIFHLDSKISFHVCYNQLCSTIVELICCMHFKRLAYNVNLALNVHLVHSIHLAYSIIIKIQAVGAEIYHSRENLAKR